MKRRRVDKWRLALQKAADLDDTGFDWLSIDLSDQRVALLVSQDHGKGIAHPGLGCCSGGGE